MHQLFTKIPIETPIQPKMDVSPFQRVLVAGFVTGGTDEVDTNLETVRLLRTQLRNKSRLQVIDTDVLSLGEIATEQALDSDSNGADVSPSQPELPRPEEVTSEQGLEPYERIFANVSYWKTLGQEYQEPLIVTGTVFFTPHSRSGVRDAGARSVRFAWSAAGRAGSHIPRPQRVCVEPKVHLHRRPHRNHAVLGTAPRGDSL